MLYSPLPLSAGSHLFVDDYLVETSEGLVRTTHQPVKLPEPILQTNDGKHVGVLWHLKVLQDQERNESPFRILYIACCQGPKDWHYAYAESNDGLEWRLPELGLVDIGGSKANNIVKTGAYCLFLVDHGRDWPAPSQRYVLLYTGAASFSAAYSPDGLHWTDHPTNPLYKDDKEVMEDKLSGCWDPLRKCYILTTGYRGRPQDGFEGTPPFNREGCRRMVGQMTSKDLVHWTPFRPIVVEDPEKPGSFAFFETICLPTKAAQSTASAGQSCARPGMASTGHANPESSWTVAISRALGPMPWHGSATSSRSAIRSSFTMVGMQRGTRSAPARSVSPPCARMVLYRVMPGPKVGSFVRGCSRGTRTTSR